MKGTSRANWKRRIETTFYYSAPLFLTPIFFPLLVYTRDTHSRNIVAHACIRYASGTRARGGARKRGKMPTESRREEARNSLIHVRQLNAKSLVRAGEKVPQRNCDEKLRGRNARPAILYLQRAPQRRVRENFGIVSRLDRCLRCSPTLESLN